MLLFENVSKSYPGPEGRVNVLADINLRLEPGDLGVVQGPSGCGKSTLLFTAGALLPPDDGRVRFAGRNIYELSAGARNTFRGNSVGFIFQKFHLVPYLNVEDNILWPLRWSQEMTRLPKRLPETARRLGIQHRLTHRPAQLSVGEQQRVAVARALLGQKALLCADEPTGNLDEENAALVLEVLKEEAARGCTVLLVTHQSQLSGVGNLHFRLGESGLVRTEKATTPPTITGDSL